LSAWNQDRLERHVSRMQAVTHCWCRSTSAKKSKIFKPTTNDFENNNNWFALDHLYKNFSQKNIATNFPHLFLKTLSYRTTYQILWQHWQLVSLFHLKNRASNTWFYNCPSMLIETATRGKTQQRRTTMKPQSKSRIGVDNAIINSRFIQKHLMLSSRLIYIQIDLQNSCI